MFRRIEAVLVHFPTSTPHSAVPSPPRQLARRAVAAVPGLVTRATRGRRLAATAGLLVSAGLVLWDALGLQAPTAGVGGRSGVFVGALVALTASAAILLWKVPERQAARRGGEAGVGTKELFEIENAARATLGQILGGLAVLAGLLVGWQQLGNTGETLRISQEGQITERFTRAVEQLASEDLAVRLGGIYALERIAGDSARDHGPVMEVLTAFAREATRQHEDERRSQATPAGPPPRVPPDVQAVLTVIGRRDASRDGGRCLDLTGTNLAGADLFRANLLRVCLGGTDLTGAVLAEADLSGANLDGASLMGADLGNANLTGASLSGADLTAANLSRGELTEANLLDARLGGAILEEARLRGAVLHATDLGGAVLFGADLKGADLTDANLAGAMLSGADLAGAHHLTQEQVDAAVIDDRTALPEGLRAHPDY